MLATFFGIEGLHDGGGGLNGEMAVFVTPSIQATRKGGQTVLSLAFSALVAITMALATQKSIIREFNGSCCFDPKTIVIRDCSR